MSPDERDLLAADFVLGTLDEAERVTAYALVETDPDFAAAVQAWEDRLAPLDDGTPAVQPPAEVWSRIDAAIADPVGSDLFVDAVEEAEAPEPAPPPFTPAVEVPEADAGERLADSAGPINVIDLRRGVSRWRAIAVGAMAVAAGLAAVVVIDRLPQPTVSADGRYIAVINTDGSLPAMIVDVDTANGQVTVRPVAAEQPPDRNLELWAIPEGGQPVSLGLVDPRDPVLRIRPERAGVIPTRGALAVSVEPVGGSPTGAPTGPVVYSGALVPVR